MNEKYRGRCYNWDEVKTEIIEKCDEKEFSHTMNTFSGLPSSFSKKSVTVISENAMKADALATALNAMKLEQAINYSNKEGIKALFITEIEGQTKLLFSDDLEQVKI